MPGVRTDHSTVGRRDLQRLPWGFELAAHRPPPIGPGGDTGTVSRPRDGSKEVEEVVGTDTRGVHVQSVFVHVGTLCSPLLLQSTLVVVSRLGRLVGPPAVQREWTPCDPWCTLRLRWTEGRDSIGSYEDPLLRRYPCSLCNDPDFLLLLRLYRVSTGLRRVSLGYPHGGLSVLLPSPMTLLGRHTRGGSKPLSSKPLIFMRYYRTGVP